MDSSRFAQIQNLFHQAADLPVPEQRAFLDKACDGDESLRTAVLEMLNEDAQRLSILDRELPEVAQALLDAQGAPLIANEFEPYKITGTLGEGGMGIVFLAERGDIGGQVAIKVLRDALLSPARRERFAREQKTLARLNHPSIARIFDAHTSPNGTPWFVMEYVDGLPVTEYCRTHKCLIDERLRLFRSVCEAVLYAHSHAIIHRDLKPSNILVTGEGTVKLVDFGIAKHTEDGAGPAERMTLTGLRPMTVAYASPEQIRGDDPGTRTDVYSLGVVLYELLTETFPFDLSKVSQSEAERIIEQQEPRLPSAVARQTSNFRQMAKGAWSELDVLCLTAMHKDLPRRYASVEALIRDVDHYLQGEPLEARSDTLRYRVSKFIGRNRRVLLASAAVLAVVGALGVLFVARLNRARDTTLAEAMRTKRIEQFMLNLFDGGDKEAGPSSELRVVSLLERGVQNARALNAEPTVQAELYQTLGSIYQKLGKFDKADPLLSSALERDRSVAGPNSSDAADGLITLGRLRLAQGELPEAERMVREGLAIYTRNLGPSDPAMARGLFALGTVLEERGSYAEAIKVLDNALQTQSSQREITPDLAYGLSALATAHYYLGQLTEADALNRRALDMDRRLYGAVHPRVADDLVNRGEIQHDMGHDTEAEKSYREALSIKQSWYGKEHPDTAISMAAVAQALTYQRRYDEAALVLQEAVAIQSRVLGKMHPQVAMGLNTLGVLELKRGHLDDAEAAFSHMADINRAAYGDRHLLVGVALLGLGDVYTEQKRMALAEHAYREALGRFTEKLPPGHVNIAFAQLRLGHALVLEQRHREAESHLLSGYDVLAKQVTAATLPRLQGARQDLAAVYTVLNDPGKAGRFQAEWSAKPANTAGISTPK